MIFKTRHFKKPEVNEYHAISSYNKIKYIFTEKDRNNLFLKF